MTVGRVIVCGGRDYDHILELVQALDSLKPTFIIEGGARGADRMGRDWAKARGVPFQTIEAQWNALGKRAGALRNGQMLLLRPDRVIAFRGGSGTQNMVHQARQAGVGVIRINW
jgi:hypothetical protein